MSSAAETRRIALLVEYDGTQFVGSQSQPGQRTVQDTLEAAVMRFTGEQQRLRFAGRTDSGVHARGQVATLETSTRHEPARWVAALNRFLPADVAVRAACEVTADFDPRRSAQSRRYTYAIEDGRPRSPLTQRQAWQLEAALDVAAMSLAASLLPTEQRDWSAFSGPLEPGRSPLRSLQACTVRRTAPHRVQVSMEAESFLPHQVRRTVGALRDVGMGRLTPQAFAGLLDSTPASVGPAAPPQGLTLVAVRYARGMVDWHDDEDLSTACGQL
jgi:tRNA pseudouridine38-40 synthase